MLSRRGQITRIVDGPKYKVVGTIGDSTLLRGVMNVNGWNQYHIIARGPVLMQLVNGQLMAVAHRRGHASTRRRKGCSDSRCTWGRRSRWNTGMCCTGRSSKCSRLRAARLRVAGLAAQGSGQGSWRMLSVLLVTVLLIGETSRAAQQPVAHAQEIYDACD